MSTYFLLFRRSSTHLARNSLRQGGHHNVCTCPFTYSPISSSNSSRSLTQKFLHHQLPHHCSSSTSSAAVSLNTINDAPSQQQPQPPQQCTSTSSSSASFSPLPDQIEQERQKWTRTLGGQKKIRTQLNCSNLLEAPAAEWSKMPGYRAMLNAYGIDDNDDGGLQKQQQGEGTAAADPDQLQTVTPLNFYQRKAFAAALNLNIPFVAVRGCPGSGKSSMVAELAHQMSVQQGKRVVVVCPSRESVYNLVGFYLKLSRNCENFVHLQPYDEETALRLAPKCAEIRAKDWQNASIRKMLSKRSLVEKLRKKGTNIALADLLRSSSIRAQTQVIFATPSDLAELLDTQLPSPLFDAVLLEDANFMHELDTWRLILQLAPLVRMFFDARHFTLSFHPPDQQFHSENFERPLLRRLEYESQAVSFDLPRQYRSNPSVQVWSFRHIYRDSYAMPVLREGRNEVRIDDLLDQLVMDYESVQTNPILMVDTAKPDGRWTEAMFRPIPLPSPSGISSFVNWGEAILTAAHLNALFQYGIYPSKLACLTPVSAHGEAVRRILSILNPAFRTHYERVEVGPVEQYLGREFECVVKSFVTDSHLCAYLDPSQPNNPFNLHYLSLEFMRTKRQTVLVAPVRRLYELHTEWAYGLVRVANDRGKYVTPSELFRLEPGQFEHIVREASSSGWANRESDLAVGKQDNRQPHNSNNYNTILERRAENKSSSSR